MQTLSDIPELVRCFKYNPPPKAQGRSTSQVCHLVMELMEVCLRLSGAPCALHAGLPIGCDTKLSIEFNLSAYIRLDL